MPISIFLLDYMLILMSYIRYGYTQTQQNTEFFSVGTQPNVFDIINNGVTYIYYQNKQSNREKLTKINPLEIFSRYFISLGEQVQIVKIRASPDKEHSLNITSLYDHDQKSILVKYNCLKSDEIVVTFTIEAKRHINKKTSINLESSFSIIKYCGNFLILDLSIGLTKVQGKQVATSEIVKFGKISSVFSEDENINKIDGDIILNKYYISYQPSWDQYSRILQTEIKELMMKKRFPQISSIKFKEIKIYSENSNILSPYLLLDGKQLNTEDIVQQTERAKLHNTQKQNKTANKAPTAMMAQSFLQLSSGFIGDLKLKDNLIEVSKSQEQQQESSNNEMQLQELIKLLNQYQVKNLTSPSGQKLLQNGLLIQLNQIILNLQHNLFDSVKKFHLKNNQKCHKEEKSARQAYADVLKQYVAQQDSVEKQNKLLTQQNEFVKQFLESESKRDNQPRQVKELIAFTQQILEQQNSDKLVEVQARLRERGSKVGVTFEYSQTDITKKEVLSKFEEEETSFELIEGRVSEITVIYNCSRSGSSKVTLELIPVNVYNPFVPISIQWTKVCKQKAAHKYLQVKFVDLQNKKGELESLEKQSIYSNGQIQRIYQFQQNQLNQEQQQFIQVFAKQNQVTVQLVIALKQEKEMKRGIQQILAPILTVGIPDILEADIRYLESGNEQLSQSQQSQMVQEDIFLKPGQPASFKINFKCKQFGTSTVSVQFVILGPYLPVDFVFKKICSVSTLNINVYNSLPTSKTNEELRTNYALIVQGDVVAGETEVQMTKRKNPRMDGRSVNQTFYIASQTMDNNHPFPISISVITNASVQQHHENEQTKPIGKFYVFPRQIMYRYEKFHVPFYIEFDCYQKGMIDGNVQLHIANYKNITFAIQKQCDVIQYSKMRTAEQTVQAMYVLLKVIIYLLIFMLFSFLIWKSYTGVPDISVSRTSLAVPTVSAAQLINTFKLKEIEQNKVNVQQL